MGCACMDERGVIQHRERAKQIIDFSGLKYGKCTPTDIDGLIELGGKVFIFIEYKFSDTPIKRGQELAFERVVDIVNKTKPTLLIHAQHFEPVEKDIDAANAKVVRVRTDGRWFIEGWVVGSTVKEVVDKFIEKRCTDGVY